MVGPEETSAILEEFEGQPSHVRQIFIYAVCQSMVEAGLLEFTGASNDPAVGTFLMYRNPDTDQIFEIVKPDIGPQEEEDIRKHIRELLEKQA